METEIFRQNIFSASNISFGKMHSSGTLPPTPAPSDFWKFRITLWKSLAHLVDVLTETVLIYLACGKEDMSTSFLNSSEVPWVNMMAAGTVAGIVTGC